VNKLIRRCSNSECALPHLQGEFSDKFPEIVITPITEAEVISTISSLKNKNSCGYDGL
jgi:hypothetical protein